VAQVRIDAPKRFTYHGIIAHRCSSEVAMQLNIRFTASGAIIALVYMTIVSSLDDISRLIIVGGLVALVVIIEKRAPKS
jgi:hypothetical protein